MKFNKGERIVRTNHPCTNLYVGDIGKIKDIYPNTHVYIVINERNGKEQTWSEDYVEAVNPSIVIYQKGREVIASLKSGKETIKTAKAICNPSDEFDFNVGAKLAFQRLMGEDEKVAKADTSFIKLFDWQAFKSGKFAVHCDTEEKAKAFLKECDEQGIKWCTGARPIVEQKETRWNGYKERTAYGCDSFGGLCYGTHDERTKVDYQPSIPTVREVHRPAKAGEWIRVIHHASYAYGNYNIGDVIKIEKYYWQSGIVEASHNNSVCRFLPDDYVVLENHTPEPVFKKAKAGDKIKVVKERDYGHQQSISKDDSLKIVRIDNEGIWSANNNYYYDKDEEYIIIEEAPEPVKPHLEVATMDELLTEIKRRTEGKA